MVQIVYSTADVTATLRTTTTIIFGGNTPQMGSTIEFAVPDLELRNQERKRFLGALWSRQAVQEAVLLERRLERPLREKAPRWSRALECRRYVRPIHKARVCSSASRYRVLM